MFSAARLTTIRLILLLGRIVETICNVVVHPLDSTQQIRLLVDNVVLVDSGVESLLLLVFKV